MAEISNTGVDKTIKETEESVRLLNFVDVYKNQYIDNNTPTMVVTASKQKIASCNILKGDVFVTPSSEVIDEIGFSAVATEDFSNAVYSYHIMRVRISNQAELHPHFLNYLFNGSIVRDQIRRKAQGITRFGLTQPKWKSILIPIPPLSEQRRIVAILDKFDALTHSISEGLPKEIALRRQQYEYYRNALLNFPKG